MSEQLDIDPLLREYLEHRRGLTGEEIDKLLLFPEPVSALLI